MVAIIVTIVHAPALRSREQHVRDMCQAFSECGATVVIVMGPEPPITDPALLSTMVNMDPGKLGDINMTSVFGPLLQDMKVRQLSNALKHAAAIQYIASQDHPSDSWHLVLEDDAMIIDAAAIIAACSAAPSDADLLFLGFPSATSPSADRVVRYHPFQGVTLIPSCEAYAVRMQTARFMSTSILPIRFRTDIHLSWLIATTAIKTYITSPNLSIDGSKVGTFVSTIESNNTLCFNPDYQALSEMAARDDSSGVEEFIAKYKGMAFADHPDSKVLLALRLAKAGRVEDAITNFASALEAYTSEGAVVGNDSSFMKVYMDLYKYKQIEV